MSTGFPGSWHQDAPPSPSAAARPGTTRRVDVDLDLVWEIWIFGGERPDGAHWRRHHPGRRSLPPSRTNSARDAAEWCGGEEHHELARARTPQRDDRGPLGPDPVRTSASMSSAPWDLAAPPSTGRISAVRRRHIARPTTSSHHSNRRHRTLHALPHSQSTAASCPHSPFRL